VAERVVVGECTLILGRCEDVLPTLGLESFDLVITSPPYNLGNSSGGGFPSFGNYDPAAGMAARGGKGKWRKASAPDGIANGYGTHGDSMPHHEYVDWQKRCLSDMWRVLKPSGAIFYNHKPRIFGGRLVTPLEYNPGLPVRQIVIWARAGGINFAPTHYVPTHEWLVIFAHDDFRLKSKGASGVGDVWYIPQEANPDHPAPFPLQLPRRILETTGAKSVLDCFAGSGTTLVAAMQSGRRAVGVECDERFFRIAVERCRECNGDNGLYAAAGAAPAPAGGLFGGGEEG
jgi:site-specific DNA-methyltransferase (adenine-specific)